LDVVLGIFIVRIELKTFVERFQCFAKFALTFQSESFVIIDGIIGYISLIASSQHSRASLYLESLIKTELLLEYPMTLLGSASIACLRIPERLQVFQDQSVHRLCLSRQ